MRKSNQESVVIRPQTSNLNMQQMFWSNVSVGHGKNMFQQYKDYTQEPVLVSNTLFQKMVGKMITLTLRANRLTFQNQQVQPIFTGKVVQVTNGYITLDSVLLQSPNQKDFAFPKPLHFPIEKISNFKMEEKK